MTELYMDIFIVNQRLVPKLRRKSSYSTSCLTHNTSTCSLTRKSSEYHTRFYGNGTLWVSECKCVGATAFHCIWIE